MKNTGKKTGKKITISQAEKIVADFLFKKTSKFYAENKDIFDSGKKYINDVNCLLKEREKKIESINSKIVGSWTLTKPKKDQKPTLSDKSKRIIDIIEKANFGCQKESVKKLVSQILDIDIDAENPNSEIENINKDYYESIIRLNWGEINIRTSGVCLMIDVGTETPDNYNKISDFDIMFNQNTLLNPEDSEVFCSVYDFKEDSYDLVKSNTAILEDYTSMSADSLIPCFCRPATKQEIIEFVENCEIILKLFEVY